MRTKYNVFSQFCRFTDGLTEFRPACPRIQRPRVAAGI